MSAPEELANLATLLPAGLTGAETTAHAQTLRAGALALSAAETMRAPASTTAPAGSPQRDKPAVALPVVPLARAGDSLPEGDAPDLLVLSRLGEGGMGTVDLARQRSLEREVALKRLRPGMEHLPVAAALLREGRVTGQLEHPGVVPVYALGVDAQGSPVLVMKRVEGVSWEALLRDRAHPLWQRLAPEGTEPLDANLELLRQVCNALEFAHARGVLHRDVKPENVMVGHFGEVYLVDWGVALEPASLTDAEKDTVQLAGTPCFLPPEFLLSPLRMQDERSDVYLLGATLHYALTGRHRHEGRNLEEVLLAAARSEPYAYPPTVPEELAALCNDATAKDPARRPATVEAFRQRIEEHRRHRGSLALARAAREALDRARALPMLSTPDLGHAASEARRLLWEARFGFAQALAGWQGNALARAGLQECVEELARRELAQRNAEGARALLEELPSPNAELREALEALQRELEEERAHARRGREEAHERDATLSQRARTVGIAVGAVVATVGTVVGTRAAQRAGRAPGNADSLRFDVGLLLFCAIAAFAARKRLFANRVGRQLFLTLLGLVLSGAATDLAAWRFDAPLAMATAQRFVAGACVLGVGAVAIDPRFALATAVLLLGALVVLLAPPLALTAGGAINLAVGLCLLWAWRARRQSPGGDQSPPSTST